MNAPLRRIAETAPSAGMDVYRRLREAILTGIYEPEQKLRFADLQARYDAGIGTLREALSQLLSEKLVTLDAGRGFRVAPVSEEDLLDITKLHIEFETRAALDSVRHGDEEWEAAVLTSFHRLSKIESLSRAERMQRHAEWVERHRAFHATLVSACTSKWLLTFRATIYDQSERYRLLSKRFRPADSAKVQEHVEIKDAALNRDAELTARLLGEHIRETADNVLKHAPHFIKKLRRAAPVRRTAARSA